MLGDLDDALADGRLALDATPRPPASCGGPRWPGRGWPDVLRWRGEFAEADRLFAEANSAELPDRLRAALHEHAGRSCYDQGRLIEAWSTSSGRWTCARRGAELIDRIRVALDAVAGRARRTASGPYPRSRERSCGRRRPRCPARRGAPAAGGTRTPTATWSSRTGTPRRSPSPRGWPGYAGRTAPWELIDPAGATLIGPTRLPGAGRSPTAWPGCRRTARRLVGDRPDRHRADRRAASTTSGRSGAGWRRFARGGWGAVDRHGGSSCRPATRLATALADGRTIDGFTDEGLAVVEVARPPGCGGPDRHGAGAAGAPGAGDPPGGVPDRRRAGPLGRAGPAGRAADRPGAPESRRGRWRRSTGCWPTPARCSEVRRSAVHDRWG